MNGNANKWWNDLGNGYKFMWLIFVTKWSYSFKIMAIGIRLSLPAPVGLYSLEPVVEVFERKIISSKSHCMYINKLCFLMGDAHALAINSPAMELNCLRSGKIAYKWNTPTSFGSHTWMWWVILIPDISFFPGHSLLFRIIPEKWEHI